MNHHSTLASLQAAAETLRHLEAQAYERGSLARAAQLARLAEDYEKEIASKLAEAASEN